MKSIISMFNILSIVSILFLSSCSSVVPNINDKSKTIELPVPINIKVKIKDAPLFVRSHLIKDKILNEKVSLNQQKTTLIDAINIVMPQMNIIVADSDVQLNKKISVRANKQTFKDYLQQLANASKYHISTDGKSVIIASVMSKTWDLSTLSMSSKAPQFTENKDENNAGKTVVVQNKDAPRLQLNQLDNNWLSIVTELQKMLGPKAIVTSNKKIGIISAIASPDKIKIADTWLSDLAASSVKQVHLKVSIIETSINSADGSGIDFSLLLKGNKGTFGISNEAITNINNAGSINVGTLLKTPLVLGEVNLEFLLNFLAKQGQIKVTNFPNLKIINGNSGKLKTGSKFDYIASVKSSTDQNGNIVSTPVVKTKDIGLQLELTAKISKDNKRIVVNVLPVVSSIKSINKVLTGSGQTAQEVVLLDIALTELSTQVIVKPNETVLIGGLYADSLTNNSKGLNNSFLNNIFGSFQRSQNKTEILILLTAILDV